MHVWGTKHVRMGGRPYCALWPPLAPKLMDMTLTES